MDVAILKNIKKFLKSCALLVFYFKWLYKNRYERMDANIPINEKSRRDFHKDRYLFSLKHMTNKIDESCCVLDAACGTGYGSNILKKLDPKKIIGVDICGQTIDYANKKYRSKNCIFIKTNLMETNCLPKNEFGLIVSFETIEHLENPRVLLENFSNALKKNGHLIISTPNNWGISKHHKFNFNYQSFKKCLEQYFIIEEMYSQNSGSKNIKVNRGMPRKIEKCNNRNIKTAECFIAICQKN